MVRYYYLEDRNITFVENFDGYADEAPPWRHKCYLVTGMAGIIFGVPPASLIGSAKRLTVPPDWIATHTQVWEKLVKQFGKIEQKKPYTPVEYAGLKVFAKLSGKSEEKLKVLLHAKKTRD